MKTLKQILIAGVALIFLFTSCEKIENVTPIAECELENNEHPNAAKYQEIINDLLAAGVPGVSVTVRTPDGVWSQCGGKADLENNTDLSSCHVLRAGSMSKVFASTAILILQEEGILSINDKINKYIPSGITDNIENANDVSIKQVLNMTSGIGDYLGITSILGIMNLSNERLSAEENLETIYGKPALLSPGEDVRYSNSNYLLAALVIKYASGKTANEIIQEKIINDLGLSNTYVSTSNPDNLSRAYIDTYGKGYMQDVTEFDNNAVGGEDMLDGGMISSSYDMTGFLELLMKGQVLSDTSLNQMKETLEITEDLGEITHVKEYGLGLMYIETNNEVAFGHYGSVYAFSGLVFHFPVHEITISVMINGSSGELAKQIWSEEIFSHLF